MLNSNETQNDCVSLPLKQYAPVNFPRVSEITEINRHQRHLDRKQRHEKQETKELQAREQSDRQAEQITQYFTAFRNQFPDLPDNIFVGLSPGDHVHVALHLYLHDCAKYQFIAEPYGKFYTSVDGTLRGDDQDDLSKDILAACNRVLDECHAFISSEKRLKLHSPNFWADAKKAFMILPGITVPADKVDADPYLLGLPNGVTNLETGAITVSDKNNIVTMRAGCNPVSPQQATSEQKKAFGKFIKLLFNAVGKNRKDNGEFIRAFRIWCYYWLTGDHPFDNFWYFQGDPGSGKSTILETISVMMGDYGSTIRPAQLLEQKGFERHTTDDYHMLYKKRFGFCDEFKAKNTEIDKEKMKRLSAGGRYACRQVNKNNIEFDVAIKLIMASNHKPDLTDEGDTFRRRIIMVNFERPANLKIEDLDAQIKATIKKYAPPLILSWILDARESALTCFKSNKLPIPAFIQKASDRFCSEQDKAWSFFEESFQIDKGNNNFESCLDEITQLYNKEYPGEAKAMTVSAMGKILGDFQFRKSDSRPRIRGKKRTVYYGLKMKPFSVAEFLEDKYESDPTDVIGTDRERLYNQYDFWCKENTVPPIIKSEFELELNRLSQVIGDSVIKFVIEERSNKMVILGLKARNVE